MGSEPVTLWRIDRAGNPWEATDAEVLAHPAVAELRRLAEGVVRATERIGPCADRTCPVCTAVAAYRARYPVAP